MARMLDAAETIFAEGGDSALAMEAVVMEAVVKRAGTSLIARSGRSQTHESKHLLLGFTGNDPSLAGSLRGLCMRMNSRQDPHNPQEKG